MVEVAIAAVVAGFGGVLVGYWLNQRDWKRLLADPAKRKQLAEGGWTYEQWRDCFE